MIPTERIKLCHQDIRFVVTYQRGKVNQSDYLSRHAKPIAALHQEELLKQMTSIIPCTYFKPHQPSIAWVSEQLHKPPTEDHTLQKIATLIKKGQSWIPKTELAEVQRFRPILPQITVTENGIILKDEMIIVPTKFQERAIELAHKGAHPGQERLKRRLRYHFFFHGMDKKVEDFVKSCSDCNVFVDDKDDKGTDQTSLSVREVLGDSRSRFIRPDGIIQARGGNTRPSIKISCSEVSDLNTSRQSHTSSDRNL